MSLPREWVTTALVGADRAQLPGSEGLTPALAALRASLDGRPAADIVLLMAGATGLHDDAGRLPARVAATEWYLPALRIEGDRPSCSRAASAFLERMFNQQNVELLPELLTLLDDSGQRIADEMLPHALAHGARIPRVRPQLLPVLGERGRWLGAVNPAWRYAAVELDDWRSVRAAWERDASGRGALALALRRRAPAMARRLIDTGWRGESALVRRELLSVLETGLSIDDEPFLEHALDDLDAQVRLKAAALLASLPGSRLVGRMIDTAGDFLTIAGGHLTPRFPALIPGAMVRDGVTRPVGNMTSASERTRLLLQTIGAIPPGHWETHLGVTPDALVAAAGLSRWPRTLMTALATAAARHRDLRWVRAILDHEGLNEHNGALVGLLSPEEMRVRLTTAVVDGHAGEVVVILRRWSHRWDEASARLLIDFLADESTRGKDTQHSPTIRFLMRSFARSCPPTLAGYAGTAVGSRAATKAWEPGLRLFIATLALRRELHEAVGHDDRSAPA